MEAAEKGDTGLKRCEVRAVKRRLELYNDLLEMAAEKDREAILLQEKYENLAGAKAISYAPQNGGSGREKTSIYHEIFAEQLEADRKAAKYRLEAKRIERFIGQIGDTQETKLILERAYLKGDRYWDIGEDLGYTKDGIRKKIDRCLEDVPASVAEASQLI